MFESMRETRRHLGSAALLAVQAALASLACAFALQSALDSFARLNAGSIREAASIGVVRVSDVEEGADAAVLRADLSAIRLPGVQDTVVSDAVPFGGRAHRYGVCTSESAMVHSMNAGTADVAGCDRVPVVTASSGLLAMLGAGIVLGRDAMEEDMVEGAPVVLISESLAAHLFGTGNAVGRHLYFGPGSSRVIVGVFASVAGPAPGGNERDSQWVLLPGLPMGASRYYLAKWRSEVDRSSLDRAADALQRPYRIMHPAGVETLAGYRDAYVKADRFATTVLAVMTAVVLGVLMAGVSGVVGAWLDRRRHSIGVRRTLGARRSVIFAEIMFEVSLFTTLGTLLGALSLQWVGSPQDGSTGSPWFSISSAVVLVMAACLTALVPRALRIAKEPPLTLLKPL
ncbi:TPA: FtsX-like permease family protein [Stenotrophomonas maltophilia]